MEKLKNTYFEHRSASKMLACYVWWVLQSARERNIKTLYFLARDGYILSQIAQLFCDHFGFSIECRYLYCSRQALRLPSYHLIGDEMSSLLWSNSYHASVHTILNRTNLTLEQRMFFLSQLSIDPDKHLSTRELEDIVQIFNRDMITKRAILDDSRCAFADISDYLRQEGLLNQETVAIVDSGWMGSMQRSLRQILRNMGYQGNLVGFYFGLYHHPTDPDDGEYHAFYFSPRTNLANKVFFSNNLFECMVSAPHGMTTGFRREHDAVVPIFSKIPSPDTKLAVEEQIQAHLSFAKGLISNISYVEMNCFYEENQVNKDFRRLMTRPIPSEVSFYRRIMFSDDSSETGHRNLVSEEDIHQLKYQLFHRKVLIKLKKGEQILLFWPFGTITFLPRWIQFWYRWNLYFCEFLRNLR